jgi:hypothetical protein
LTKAKAFQYLLAMTIHITIENECKYALGRLVQGVERNFKHKTDYNDAIQQAILIQTTPNQYILYIHPKKNYTYFDIKNFVPPCLTDINKDSIGYSNDANYLSKTINDAKKNRQQIKELKSPTVEFKKENKTVIHCNFTKSASDRMKPTQNNTPILLPFIGKTARPALT